MDSSFWLEVWESNELGFHENNANPLLVEHLKTLDLAKGSRLFLPLCGKTLDIAWLLSQGYRVAGAELSQKAVEQFFAELGVEPTVNQLADLQHYSAEGVDIFCGNIFALNKDSLGPIDAIYDRAALVALPDTMRPQYSSHLLSLTNAAPQLLITLKFDQSLSEGPPFTISAEEVQQHYSNTYSIKQLASVDMAGGLKGKCPADEQVWLLSK